MPKSYRIRTQLGINQNIPVKIPIVLEQNFDTLEILSLAIRPDDIYIRSCADYGVVCGRIFCNNGFGIPNARVSIFVPIEQIDTQNDYIASLYPYTNFTEINEDGYRYNLLPYTQSHSGHVPVGTFPERLDVLTDKSVIQVYEKYYKFTVKTNESGDYMIFGVPVGQQTLFMQVDLSDIGEFSLTPQDLIRMGLATEDTVNGSKFKFSTNYAELPQIITSQKTVQIEPFFGEFEICNYNIARVDFDLTSENNVKLEPTAVFMGSIVSTDDTQRVGKNFKFFNQTQSACKVKRTAGELCAMTTGPGQIIALRQTIFSDENGRPILEQATLDNDGKVIDENGVWVLEVPMNLDYVYTDENGKRKISNDPKLGVPTRGKYRFKVKWSQSPSLSDTTKRAYFLLPNIKERGWTSIDNDPISEEYGTFQFTENNAVLPDSDLVTAQLPVLAGQILRIKTVQNVRDLTITDPNGNPYISQVFREPGTYILQFYREDPAAQYFITFYNIPFNRFMLEGSYAFSLDWNDYAVPDEAINCKDTFYDISYNKVYTTTQFIDRYQGSRYAWNTVGVKKITDTSCQGDYNTFPTNDAFYRFDFIYLVISFFLNIFKFLSLPILFLVHILAWLMTTGLPLLFLFLIGYLAIQAAQDGSAAISFYSNVVTVGVGLGAVTVFNWGILALAILYTIYALIYIALGVLLATQLDKIKEIGNKLKNFTLPLVLYTDDGCERCKCNSSTSIDTEMDGSLGSFPQPPGDPQTSFLINSTSTVTYNGIPASSIELVSQVFAGSTEGNFKRYPIQGTYYNSIVNGEVQLTPTGEYYTTTALPPSELYNLFNTKSKYFNNVPNFGSGSELGWNQIKSTWFPSENSGLFHYDNIMVLVLDKTAPDYSLGQLLSFQDSELSGDVNKTVTTGTTIFPPVLTVTYADPDSPLGQSPNQTRTYIVPVLSSTTSVDKTTAFAADVEYFQVITGMTIAQYSAMTNPNSHELSFGVRYLQRITPQIGQSVLNVPFIRIMPGKATGIISAGYSTLRNYVDDYDEYKLVIIQRGVDTHSPRIPQKIDLSRIFGYDYGDSPTSLIVEGELKMNYPITGTIYSDRHDEILNNTSNLFKPSYAFTYTQNDYITNGSTTLPSYYSSVSSDLFNAQTGAINWNTININSVNPYLYVAITNENGVPVNNVGLDILDNITVSNGAVLTVNATNNSCVETSSNYNVNTFTKVFTNPDNITVQYGDVNEYNTFTFYLGQKDNRCFNVRNVLGYQGDEIVDGASFMRSNFSFGGQTGIAYIEVTPPIGPNYYIQINPFTFTDNTGANYNQQSENYQPSIGTPRFFSTQYSTGMTTTLGNGLNIVFRSDRLPTSTNTQINGINSFLLHQNSQFAIFKVSDEGESVQVITIDTTPQTNNESSQIFTPPSYAAVLDSLSDCTKAVPLPCYGINSQNQPIILPNCVEDYIDPSDSKKYFLKGYGCYNFVSKPITTLGKDIKNIVELFTRINLNLALCFDITSHNFTNQYVNGTLYAYPFQNQRIFDLNNNPSSLYCTDLIYLHDQTSNFYYRSSPFQTPDQNNPEIGSFIGKKNNRGNATSTGNNKFLGSPTTLLDLGPKSDFIQELVYNDDYDGYIVSKVKSTSFQSISDILNMFILSRLINTSFNEQLTPNTESGDEGSSDPSVKALFSNSRWNNNGATFVPGYIDGDYSQMIAINSQFGITEFSSESYGSDSVFLGQNTIPLGGGASVNFPLFGLLLTGDTQDRDYISPRRTIWNSGGTLTNNQQLVDCWFTNITTNSQEVPFYQWSLDYLGGAETNIFGSQSNNYTTEDATFFSYKYQSLDRLNPASQYFQNDQSNGYYVRGTQINFDNNGVPTESTPQNFEQTFLVGAPFYFYFGLKKGASAMDVFITKYINTEVNV